MATTYWLRGLFAYCDPATNAFRFGKQLALFLMNVVGYTFQSQSVAGGNDFTTTEKQSSGATGSVTGSSWVLTDSSAPFASTDGGKFIVVKDSVHPENSGIYPVLQYLTASTIVVDWLCGDSEYPTASSTITWWIAADTYQAPAANGDYIRLQSPHSTGWALEIKLGGVWYDAGPLLRVAVDGNWPGGKIIGTASVTVDYTTKNHTYAYCVASDDGSCMFAFRQWLDGWRWKGALISTIDPVESGRQPYELVGLSQGTDQYVFFVASISKQTTTGYGVGQGIVRRWSDKLNSQVDNRMGEYTAAGSAAGMSFPWKSGASGTIWRESNPRLGNKMECRYGTPVFAENNDNSFPQEYGIIGVLGGHWSVRGSLTRACPLSTDGTKWDRLHLGNGIVVEWPEQFTPRELIPFEPWWW